MMFRRWGCVILFSILVLVESFAQHVPSKERVDSRLRRRTEIDGNNVRTSVFNFVFSGRTGAGQGVPYEWPKNTNRYYVALVALFAGAEVEAKVAGTERDSLIHIIDLPAYRQSPAGEDWNLNPIPGYFNPDQGKIAKSDEPETWPPYWPDKLSDAVDPGWRGSWNGFFGKNQFNADQEIYYRVGDDNYNRYDGVHSRLLYHPDTTDRTRYGLGLVVDVRVLQWSQPAVADAVFFIHEIKNDGSKDLKKAGVTLWLADFVGGDGDSQDDKPDFDLILDIAYSADNDGYSNNPAFQNASFVGVAGTIYLETPGNAEDRIDNDGDSPEYEFGPKVTYAMLQGAGSYPAERSGNQIDENHNGLIDEDSTYIPFGRQRGVGFADGIDNNGDGEAFSPVVTSTMVSQASLDMWKRWPPNPEGDTFWAPNTPFMRQSVHLIQVGSEDEGRAYKDNIDNDGNCNDNLPAVTDSMVRQAAVDPYRRYRVPGTAVVLYDLDSSDIGKKYINRDNYVDTHIDEGIDEMCDESRNDGIDNDGDWDILTDDVGLDGASNTGDYGEGDGKPTSGVGTPFPGEPNIDKTDVSEADQVGLTNVQYLEAGAIDFSRTADDYFWYSFLLPGSFINTAQIPVGESDLFVSSGVFPLKAGQIERISYAVVFGNNPGPRGSQGVSVAKADIIENKAPKARLAYDQDYQFAQAPIEPTVTAVAGDKRVTLYWNDVAEQSVDRFLLGIDRNAAKDFEGYRIYRATDPAFEDARLITDANGNPAPWLKPIAQFDLKNGIKGNDSVGFNGVKFYLGSDNGIVHSWTDSTVQNGQKYYYAVRAYDRGYPPLQISPSESNLKISIDNVTGKVRSIGTSIAIVTPEAPAAGYVDPSVSEIKLVRGGTTGRVGYTIVDPTKILDNHTYRITFEDTVLPSRVSDAPDTFKTKSYTLTDITNPNSFDTLIAQRRALEDTIEQPIVHGFRLIFQNEKFFGLNPAFSGWGNDSVWQFDFRQWRGGFIKGQQKPSDYKIIFGDLGIDTSTQFLVSDLPRVETPAIPVNFTVINTSENKSIDFAFIELDNAGGAGIFSARRGTGLNNSRSDVIVFLERDLRDTLVPTYAFRAIFDSVRRSPRSGDTATIVLSKLFRADDVFEFTTRAQRIDNTKAKNELDKIRVVPNPYVVAAPWEERNPYNTGRGPQSLHFNHLPQRCTIRIYTVSGELVATIEHDSNILDGSAEWNLLTRDNLAVSYGVYIYHIDAPGIGEKVGKFAIIK